MNLATGDADAGLTRARKGASTQLRPEITSALKVSRVLMTPARWNDVARIVVTGLVTFFYWRGVLPEWVLLVAVVVGLYPLIKTGLIDLIRHRRLGTEIFVSLATIDGSAKSSIACSRSDSYRSRACSPKFSSVHAKIDSMSSTAAGAMTQ